MRPGNIGTGNHGNSKQTIGDIKAGFDDPIEREIGLEFRLGEIEFLCLELFSVIAPIPRFNGMVSTFGCHQLGEFALFLIGFCNGTLPDIAQQFFHRFRRFGHCVIKLEISVTRIAKKFGFFGSKADNLGNQRPVLRWPFIGAACNPRLKGRFA